MIIYISNMMDKLKDKKLQKKRIRIKKISQKLIFLNTTSTTITTTV